MLKSLLWPKRTKKSTSSSTLNHREYVSGIPTAGSSGAILGVGDQEYYYSGGESSYYYQTFYDEDRTQVLQEQ